MTSRVGQMALPETELEAVTATLLPIETGTGAAAETAIAMVTEGGRRAALPTYHLHRPLREAPMASLQLLRICRISSSWQGRPGGWTHCQLPTMKMQTIYSARMPTPTAPARIATVIVRCLRKMKRKRGE